MMQIQMRMSNKLTISLQNYNFITRTRKTIILNFRKDWLECNIYIPYSNLRFLDYKQIILLSTKSIMIIFNKWTAPHQFTNKNCKFGWCFIMDAFVSASNNSYISSLQLVTRNSSSKMRLFEFYFVNKLIVYVVVCKAFKLILSFAFIVSIRGPPCWFEFQISD